MLFNNLVLSLTKNICKTVTKNEIKKLMAFTPVSSSDECACVNTVTCKKVFNHNFILKKVLSACVKQVGQGLLGHWG